ncbi:hypothetical protein SKAU_G00371360 [Synaphobranchus kaupii]|uniref:Ribonuclease A-domain domain-containing protein n=1 Tax=Synaphobranchus kaupii TaxID=118154 RepID=A0A9Q1EG70_SYNKA|nr:hypothetical protein SKAU_G00371360 [Synaphobranchus kaupii]
MKRLRVIAMRMALGFSCLFLASCSTNSAGSQSAGDPSAPQPCVVLQTDPDQEQQPPEGRLGRGGGWQWEPARARGSITVIRGCILTVWTEQGGHKTFPGGTGVHLEGWEWTSQDLALHCSCVSSPERESPYENFLRQHVDETVTRGNVDYCNEKMRERKMPEYPRCKKSNTFIHAKRQKVNKVCATAPIDRNIHCSTFNITECRYHDNESRKKNECQYKASSLLNKRIQIACKDNKPVHLEPGTC